MSTLRVSLQTIQEIDRAFDEYCELLAQRETEGHLKSSARNTYELHSRNFVRWLRGEFDPGARNRG